jgi:hypothetical protein
MNFEEYLQAKKIDSKAFQRGNIVLFSTWQNTFAQIHPDSFTEQFKFQINATRRLYPIALNV